MQRKRNQNKEGCQETEARKLQRDKYREICGTVEENKTKYACIVEAYESMRKRMEGSLHKNHEDNIAAKGINSLSHYNLVHKFIPMPHARKITECQGSSGKMWKMEKILAWQLAKVRNKKRGDRRSKE